MTKAVHRAIDGLMTAGILATISGTAIVFIAELPPSLVEGMKDVVVGLASVVVHYWEMGFGI